MSKEEVKAVLRSFGMGKFAAAVMFVLHEAIENEECRNNVRRPKGKPIKNVVRQIGVVNANYHELNVN